MWHYPQIQRPNLFWPNQNISLSSYYSFLIIPEALKTKKHSNNFNPENDYKLNQSLLVDLFYLYFNWLFFLVSLPLLSLWTILFLLIKIFILLSILFSRVVYFLNFFIEAFISFIKFSIKFNFLSYYLIIFLSSYVLLSLLIFNILFSSFSHNGISLS
jgi:hypothetical protein